MQDTIKSLCAIGKTIILIAHRLSTVRDADEIIVVHKGKVVEKGTHETLLFEKGQYASLWSQQSGVAVFEPNHVN